MARAACAWAIPGCQRGRGAGVGGAKGGSSATDRHGGVQHPERASTWRGCFSTCTTVASQHAPASHGSGAAPLSQCSVAAFRPRPGLRVRSRRSDAAMRRVSIWGGMRMAARLASKGCAVSSGHRQAPPVRCGTVCARRPRTYAESRMRRCGICPQHPGSLQCSLHEVLGSGSPSFLLARTKAPRTQDCLRTVHATKHSGPTHSSCLSAECGVQFVVRGRRQRH